MSYKIKSIIKYNYEPVFKSLKDNLEKDLDQYNQELSKYVLELDHLEKEIQNLSERKKNISEKIDFFIQFKMSTQSKLEHINNFSKSQYEQTGNNFKDKSKGISYLNFNENFPQEIFLGNKV